MIYLSSVQAIAATTRGKIITNVGIENGDNQSFITLEFAVPVQYQRHNPLGYGKEIRIQVSPIVNSAAERTDLDLHESLFPPQDNPAGVVRVEFAGRDVVEPSVTVVFDYPRYFDVKQGDDFRSVSVIVQNKVHKESAVAGQPGSEEQPETASGQQAQPERSPGRPALLPLSPQRVEELLKESVEAMTDGDYMRAIRAYTRLLDSTDPEIQENAQFQLALARELKGHLAHARAEYQTYLDDFPQGPNAKEAAKRLKQLLMQADTGLAVGESLWQVELYGNLGQYYQRDVGYPEYEEGFDGPNSIVNFSTLLTEFDATLQFRTEEYYTSAVILGSFENELEEGQDNRLRGNNIYLEFADFEETIYSRWGRQRINKGGVLGRFDGGTFGYRLSDTLMLNLVAGFPVELSYDSPDTDRYFYGINFDVSPFFLDNWNFNVYFIDQFADSIDDRQALGLEMRYAGGRGSFFSLVDYDVLYDELAVLLASGNWLLPNDLTRIWASGDFRTNPLLSTTNALIGQVSPALDSLVDLLGEDVVRQLARDRTLNSSYVSFGMSHPIASDVQISGDIAWSKLDGGPGSGGVAEIESLGDEWYYTLQFNGSNLLIDGDLSTIGVAYRDDERRDTYSLILNSSYPYPSLKDLRFRPKLRVDFRSNKQQPGDQWQFRPGFIIDYTFARRWRFEIEGEYRWANRELEGLAEDREGYYLSTGLNWSF